MIDDTDDPSPKEEVEDEDVVYLSRKRKLSNELRSLAFHIKAPSASPNQIYKSIHEVTVKITEILTRVDLGEDFDEHVTTFIGVLDASPNPPTQQSTADLHAKLIRLLCTMYEYVSEVRDFAQSA